MAPKRTPPTVELSFAAQSPASDSPETATVPRSRLVYMVLMVALAGQRLGIYWERSSLSKTLEGDDDTSTPICDGSKAVRCGGFSLRRICARAEPTSEDRAGSFRILGTQRRNR